MRHNRIWIGLCFVFSVLIFTAGALLGTRLTTPPRHYSPAIGEAAEDDPAAFVQTVSGTTPQMLRAEYWISKNNDELLYSPEQIEEFNRNNPLFVLYDSPEYGSGEKLFLEDLPDVLEGNTVRALVDPALPARLRSEGLLDYVNGAPPEEAYLNGLDALRAIDTVPETVTPRYAICVRRTVAMLLPTDDFASDSPDEHYCNEFVSAEVMPFSGVAVLHESADGQWFYILTGSYCGWVHRDTLAICRDRAQWYEACNPEQFLVVTGSELVLEETAVPSATGGMILPMGTKIKLSRMPLPQDRVTPGCYRVELPFARDDGTLGWEQALVPVSRDVHAGYLRMTSSSVIEQSFKLLGRVYGWGGTLSSNDCSGIICQIYGCYGFQLPRNALAIAKLTDLGSNNCSKMTTDRKLQILSKMPPGTLLYMDGHIMIYLGMEDSRPFVISSCATYIDPDDDSLTARDAHCVFVSGLDLRRGNGKTWLENLWFFQWKDY